MNASESFDSALRRIIITNFTMQPSASISINDIVVAEGTNGTSQAIFPVVITPPSPQTVTVDFATADASARADSDYVATNGTLVFAPGETNKFIAVTVTADVFHEADEYFIVNLTNVNNASMLKSSGLAVITEVVLAGLSVDVAISFMTGAGRFYVVEKSDDLVNWTTVPAAENVAGTGGIVVVHDPGAGCNSQRHYRLRLRQ